MLMESNQCILMLPGMLANASAISFLAGRSVPLETENALTEAELPRLAINILPISTMFLTNHQELVAIQKVSIVQLTHSTVSREGGKEK